MSTARIAALWAVALLGFGILGGVSMNAGPGPGALPGGSAPTIAAAAVPASPHLTHVDVADTGSLQLP